MNQKQIAHIINCLSPESKALLAGKVEALEVKANLFHSTYNRELCEFAKGRLQGGVDAKAGV